MKILFIHQNYPGQFKALAPALAALGHDLYALKISQKKVADIFNNGIKIISYVPKRSSSLKIHPWLLDFETKIIRGEACFDASLSLKQDGFNPDLIIAHPGWGESLFLKNVWPNSKLVIYCEFFYQAKGFDVAFDPEFSSNDSYTGCKLDMKNLYNLLQFSTADFGLSPTHWQASSFPADFKQRIKVIHEGIDTSRVFPSEKSFLVINGKDKLTVNDEIITFVNRNLEPYRGFHIFMRALPKLLETRPNARILIVGGNSISYGAKPEDNDSWKDKFVREIRPLVSSDDWKRVYFLGKIPYKYFINMLQISTVHVYLTYPFVLSWSLLEAMSCGCSVIASDTQPLHEVIQDGENGLLVDFFDSENLSNQIINLLDDEKLRKKISTNARKFVIKNYDLKTVCLPQQIQWIESIIT